MNEKVRKVILSCETPNQLLVAVNYVGRATATGLISEVESLVWAGVIGGIAAGKGWELPWSKK